jgi:alpha-L-fucosidase
MRAQRLYNNREWPDPVVLKITNVEPAMTPPAVETDAAVWHSATHTVTLSATLTALGKAPSVEAGFQYQHIRGLDINERSESWHDTPLRRMTAPGKFSATVEGWHPGESYAFRAVVKHPLVTIRGDDVKVTAK